MENDSYSARTCRICIDEYDNKDHIPLIGSCGHSICSSCVENLADLTCPICKDYMSFEFKCKNFTAIELLAEMKELSKKKTGGPDACYNCKCAFGKEKMFICTQCLDEDGTSIEDLLKKAKKSRICLDCGEAVNSHGGHFLTSFEDYEAKLKGKLFLENVSKAIELANVNINLFKAKRSEIEQPADIMKEVFTKMNAHLASKNKTAPEFDQMSQKMMQYSDAVKNASDKGNAVVEEINAALKNMMDFMNSVSDDDTTSV